MEDGLGFDLVAASLRADGTDLAAFAEALGGKLEDALPGRTTVVRRGDGMLSRHKRVRAIEVRMDDCVYAIGFDRGDAQAERRTEVRGVILRREPIDVDGWIEALSRSLAELAQRSERDRIALGRLLE